MPVPLSNSYYIAKGSYKLTILPYQLLECLTADVYNDTSHGMTVFGAMPKARVVRKLEKMW